MFAVRFRSSYADRRDFPLSGGGMSRLIVAPNAPAKPSALPRFAQGFCPPHMLVDSVEADHSGKFAVIRLVDDPSWSAPGREPNSSERRAAKAAARAADDVLVADESLAGEDLPDVSDLNPFACPTCGAAGDDPCVTNSGNVKSKPHAARP